MPDSELQMRDHVGEDSLVKLLPEEHTPINLSKILYLHKASILSSSNVCNLSSQIEARQLRDIRP